MQLVFYLSTHSYSPYIDSHAQGLRIRSIVSNIYLSREHKSESRHRFVSDGIQQAYLIICIVLLHVSVNCSNFFELAQAFKLKLFKYILILLYHMFLLVTCLLMYVDVFWNKIWCTLVAIFLVIIIIFFFTFWVRSPSQYRLLFIKIIIPYYDLKSCVAKFWRPCIYCIWKKTFQERSSKLRVLTNNLYNFLIHIVY